MNSPRRSRGKTFLFATALTVMGTIGLLLAAEIAVRVRWAIQHRDAAYLVMGITGAKERTAPRLDPVIRVRPAVKTPGTPIPFATINNSTQWNECAQKDIYYRVNSDKGRGGEWTAEKPAGVVRIIALGESSTFGAANAEEDTWPVLLQQALRARGVNAEVLNFGMPGQRIEGMIKALPAVLDKFHPDLVVHYGGFNETWVDPEVPQWLGWLNYRSMLYTYIYEKMYFRAEASPMRLVPDSRKYEKAFGALIGVVRNHGSRLVVIEQAVAFGATPKEGAVCAASWQDDQSLAACLDKVIAEPDDRYSRLMRARMLKTVVLQRVLADVAARENISVIDPRDTVVEHGDNHLFCDEIHLTDKGNAVLTDAIAGPLADYIRAQALGRSGS